MLSEKGKMLFINVLTRDNNERDLKAEKQKATDESHLTPTKEHKKELN